MGLFSRKRTTRAIAAAAAIALTAGLAACAGSGAGESSSEGEGGDTGPLKIGLSTVAPSLGQSYYSSIPQYLGYWDDAGLELDVKRFNGSGEVMTAAATGQIDIGHGGNFSIMAAHENGGADIQAFMQDIPGNPYFPLVLQDSPIQTLKDLEGKTLGIFSTASDANEMLIGIMTQQGMDPNSVNIVETGNGPTAAEALQSGKIDGWMAYDSGAGMLSTLGIDWRPIDEDLFSGYRPGSAVVASPATIESKREELVAYGQGIAKAMIFAKENPEAAVQIHWDVFPDAKPAGVEDAEALELGVVELAARTDNVFPVEDLWGNVTEEDFAEYVKVFVEAGVLGSELPVDEIWTDELIEDINDFDHDEIVEQARNFTFE